MKIVKSGILVGIGVLAIATTSQFVFADITATKAKQIALNKVGGKGTFTKFKKEYDDRRLVYDIEIRNENIEYDLTILASSGKVVEYSTETKSVPKSTQITEAKAKEIALNKVGKGKIVKFARDTDDGQSVYEVEIRNGKTEYDLTISSKDGTILEYEEDTNGFFD